MKIRFCKVDYGKVRLRINNMLSWIFRSALWTRRAWIVLSIVLVRFTFYGLELAFLLSLDGNYAAKEDHDFCQFNFRFYYSVPQALPSSGPLGHVFIYFLRKTVYMWTIYASLLFTSMHVQSTAKVQQKLGGQCGLFIIKVVLELSSWAWWCMSNYSCGALKLNNIPNGRIKTTDCTDWILVLDFGPLEHINRPLRSSRTSV